MLNLRDLFRIVWRRKAIFAAVVVVAFAAAAYFVYTRPPVYQAEALVRVDQRTADIGEALAALSLSQRLAETYARIVTTRSLAKRVAEAMEGTTSGEVLESLSAIQLGSLDLVRIRARHTDAQKAADIANTMAAELQGYVQEISEGSMGERLLIVDPAVPPGSPAGASPAVMLAIAVLAGAVLGVGLVLVLDYLDDRIVDNDELESMTGLPILGVLPVMQANGVARR